MPIPPESVTTFMEGLYSYLSVNPKDWRWYVGEFLRMADLVHGKRHSLSLPQN